VQRWRGLDSTPSGWGRSVVTIGVFDGVHRGHQQIIGRAVDKARAGGYASVLLTFDPHPSEVVRPGSHPPILTTQRTKADLVEALGVDVFCVVPFTPDFSKLAPDEFVHEVLVSSLHAAGVVVGENFRYGRKAAGDVEALTRAGRSFGFTVEGVPLIEERLGPDQPGTTFSSTYIRSCIAGGDVVSAARALGRPHRVEGVVVRGDGRGAGIGYPTANLSAIAYAAIPADGVYAGRMLRGATSLPMAISIGTNPTFEGQERRVEGYVLDFDGDLYGEHVSFEFLERLRATERYDSVEALVEQMARDVQETRRLTS
jgi:riboflavin kinase/FMN adenylyltransferase